MKKLVLGFALVIGMIGNAQKIEMSIQYFNTIKFFKEIDKSKLIQPEFEPNYDPTLVILDMNLIFDLDQKQLTINDYDFINKEYIFTKSIVIDSIDIKNKIVSVSLSDSTFYKSCKIYLKSKKIVFFNTMPNNLSVGIFADNYDKTKLIYED
jgi:hypothetical protein